MKKIILLLTLVLMHNTALFAQTKHQKSSEKSFGWFALFAGFNLPIGDFNNDQNEARAGWAEVGWMAKADIGINLHQNIGLVITPTIFQNPVNKESVKGIIRATGYTFEEIDTKPWIFKGILVGPEFKLPDAQSPFFIKLQLGYIHATSPYLKHWVGTQSQSVYVEQKEATAGAFATNVGCGLKFDLNNIVLFTLAVEYVSTKPTFKDVELTLNENGKSTYEFGEFDMHVTSIFPSIGLTWKL